jgi:hypothetical protein
MVQKYNSHHPTNEQICVANMSNADRNAVQALIGEKKSNFSLQVEACIAELQAIKKSAEKRDPKTQLIMLNVKEWTKIVDSAKRVVADAEEGRRKCEVKAGVQDSKQKDEVLGMARKDRAERDARKKLQQQQQEPATQAPPKDKHKQTHLAPPNKHHIASRPPSPRGSPTRPKSPSPTPQKTPAELHQAKMRQARADKKEQEAHEKAKALASEVRKIKWDDGRSSGVFANPVIIG